MAFQFLEIASLTVVVWGRSTATSCNDAPENCRRSQHSRRRSGESFLLQTSSFRLNGHDLEKYHSVFTMGTCESEGMQTIQDIDECQKAGAVTIGNADIGWHSDQPAGGHTTSGRFAPHGCGLHLLEAQKPIQEMRLQFFPNGTGSCGKNLFLCICKEVRPTPVPTPAPTPPAATPPALDKCHTCVEGDECFQDVRWAMIHGFRLRPEWYSSLGESSCFQMVQMFLHWRQRGDRSHWDGMLHHPIPFPCEPEESNYVSNDLLYCR